MDEVWIKLWVFGIFKNSGFHLSCCRSSCDRTCAEAFWGLGCLESNARSLCLSDSMEVFRWEFLKLWENWWILFNYDNWEYEFIIWIYRSFFLVTVSASAITCADSSLHFHCILLPSPKKIVETCRKNVPSLNFCRFSWRHEGSSIRASRRDLATCTYLVSQWWTAGSLCYHCTVSTVGTFGSRWSNSSYWASEETVSWKLGKCSHGTLEWIDSSRVIFWGNIRM